MAKKILLIDDERLVRMSLEKLLLKNGFEVIACESGAQAIAAVKSKNISLIICDVRMPKIDGITTLKEIRSFLESHHRSPIPEILITGYADARLAEEAEKMNVAEYIYKPFDLRDFLDCVKKHIVT
jgi:DNA-binding NtrC family response regulator